MRLMSFSLTTEAMRAKTKTVTRRLGWTMLKPGDRLMACEKVMGRRHGEPLMKIGEIEVTSIRRERLDRLTLEPLYGAKEISLEGFPRMTPWEFQRFFIKSHKGCQEFTMVTRIEFRHL